VWIRDEGLGEEGGGLVGVGWGWQRVRPWTVCRCWMRAHAEGRDASQEEHSRRDGSI
jgi:hypothetical protein